MIRYLIIVIICITALSRLNPLFGILLCYLICFRAIFAYGFTKPVQTTG